MMSLSLPLSLTLLLMKSDLLHLPRCWTLLEPRILTPAMKLTSR